VISGTEYVEKETIFARWTNLCQPIEQRKRHLNALISVIEAFPSVRPLDGSHRHSESQISDRWLGVKTDEIGVSFEIGFINKPFALNLSISSRDWGRAKNVYHVAAKRR
ncbi:hypothetical protein PFISCL1PPCAC_14429, partial [Pristionchus fissidentatus]